MQSRNRIPRRPKDRPERGPAPGRPPAGTRIYRVTITDCISGHEWSADLLQPGWNGRQPRSDQYAASFDDGFQATPHVLMSLRAVVLRLESMVPRSLTLAELARWEH